MNDLPVACSLSPEELRNRRSSLLPELASLATATTELEHGVAFELAASDEAIAALNRVIGSERQCCRFLRFLVSYPPDLGPVSVEVTGPAGTREFLRALVRI